MQKKFKAKAEPAGPNGAWCFLAIPFDMAEVWGMRGRVRVKGTINGFPFRTHIQPMEGRHLLTFNKQLQAGAKAKPGDVVAVVIERDTEEWAIEPPAELAKAFRHSKTAKRCGPSWLTLIVRNSRNGSAGPSRWRPASAAPRRQSA